MPSKYKSYNKRTLIDVPGHVRPILKEKCVFLPKELDPVGHPGIIATSDGKVYQTMPDGSLRRLKIVPEKEQMIKLERKRIYPTLPEDRSGEPKRFHLEDKKGEEDEGDAFQTDSES